jgi:ureidoglycolate hydrolase
MSFMRGASSNQPFLVDTLERHEYSNQVFIPMNGIFHLVVVCPQDLYADVSRTAADIPAIEQKFGVHTHFFSQFLLVHGSTSNAF